MSDATADDTMRERIEENRLKFRLLTRVDRRAFAAGLSVVVFAVLVAVSAVAPTPMRRVVESVDALWWVFSPMLTAIITAVALVVTFNQLVLSQDLGALGDQRDRMREAIGFREDVEPWLDTSVGPPDPASFVAALLDTVVSLATDLEDSVGDETPEDEAVADLAAEMAGNARSVRSRLEDAQFGTFEVVSASLNFNYSRNIYQIRRLQAEHGDALDEGTTTALDDLGTVLEFYGPAREHIKTLYFQWELVNLSRVMLYASVPALVVALSMLLYVDAAGVTGAKLGVDTLVWLVCGAVTVTLSPFFLLLSYVLRVASVTKRTLAIGPFVLRDME